jgi:hypothetical protein
MQVALLKTHISPTHAIGSRTQRLGRQVVVPLRRLHVAAAATQREPSSSSSGNGGRWAAAPATLSQMAALWAATAVLPAQAAADLGGGPPASSYYVSLGLFLMTVPGVHCRAVQAAVLPSATQNARRLPRATAAFTALCGFVF